MPPADICQPIPPMPLHAAQAVWLALGRHSARTGHSGKGTRFARCVTAVGAQLHTCRRHTALLGKTLDPSVATRYKKQLMLSGTGKILCTCNLPGRDCGSIESHLIAPLELTPVRGDVLRRTPGECIIDALVAVRAGVADAELLRSLETVLRAAWLGAPLSAEAAAKVLAGIGDEVGQWPELARQIDRIKASMEKELRVARRIDNFYGRLFETHVAEYLVAHPDTDMLAVRDRVAEFLLADLESCSERIAERIVHGVRFKMTQDPAAWSAEIPPVHEFHRNRTRQNLEAMLKYKGNKSVTLLMSLAVQYARTSPRIKATVVHDATKIYKEVILPQRNLVEREKPHPKSKLHGLLFPYQRGAHPAGATMHGVGIRPMDMYLRPVSEKEITEHDLSALRSERTVGKGMSGSANLVHYVFLALAKDDASFPMAAGHLAIAAWLAHAGGHSFNEAYTVFGYEQNKQFSPISFLDLASTSLSAAAAVDHAFERVMEMAGKLARLEPAVAPQVASIPARLSAACGHARALLASGNWMGRWL